MARQFTKEDVDRFFDYDLDLSTRTVYLGSVSHDEDGTESGCDYQMADRLIKALHLLERTEGDVTIKMNNPGGDWYHGMAIYDAIMACRNSITIIGFGQVMSMGAIIFQAADERVLAPHATMLVHYGSDGYVGHSKDFQKRASEVARLDRVMEDIFLARINERQKPLMTVPEFRQRFSFDAWIPAPEAVELGLADSIL